MELFWWILVLTAFLGFCALAANAANQPTKEDEEKLRESIRGDIEKIINKHIDTLVRKRRTLILTDDYGIKDYSKWSSEIQTFIAKVVSPQFPDFFHTSANSAQNQQASERIKWTANEVIEPYVHAKQLAEERSFTLQYDSSMSPIEYEHFCASRLRDAGWDTQVTKASGDQGADIIARNGSRVLVAQCKKYASPVGNSAVQEVAAAKNFYRATNALVIATNGFTQSARTLAVANNVLLIGHDDIGQINKILGVPESPLRQPSEISPTIPNLTPSDRSLNSTSSKSASIDDRIARLRSNLDALKTTRS